MVPTAQFLPMRGPQRTMRSRAPHELAAPRLGWAAKSERSEAIRPVLPPPRGPDCSPVKATPNASPSMRARAVPRSRTRGQSHRRRRRSPLLWPLATTRPGRCCAHARKTAKEREPRGPRPTSNLHQMIRYACRFPRRRPAGPRRRATKRNAGLALAGRAARGPALSTSIESGRRRSGAAGDTTTRHPSGPATRHVRRRTSPFRAPGWSRPAGRRTPTCFGRAVEPSSHAGLPAGDNAVSLHTHIASSVARCFAAAAAARSDTRAGGWGRRVPVLRPAQ
jgi:hypothetical protein